MSPFRKAILLHNNTLWSSGILLLEEEHSLKIWGPVGVMQPIPVKEIPSKWNEVQTGISNDKWDTLIARDSTLLLVS